ncbi:hypothetical protein MKW98_022811 [Papaver atlanticum]|uniref:Uncharacterized protein n=1 Tax=Papaver atlanticum TaxID=357466 RepID=A0AAD4TLN7_9MAGN|nr:hypothetical protein MKW98_022811 [Papaver atlanticum]
MPLGVFLPFLFCIGVFGTTTRAQIRRISKLLFICKKSSKRENKYKTAGQSVHYSLSILLHLIIRYVPSQLRLVSLYLHQLSSFYSDSGRLLIYEATNLPESTAASESSAVLSVTVDDPYVLL